jgi:group II intron reverse transcriptase/maturase
MSLRDAKRQKSEEQLELPLGYRGEAPNDQRSVEASMVANGNERSSDDCLMEQVVEEGNRQLAVKRVRQNKGSPGIDGMSVEELPRYLEGNWIRIREELLAGTYQPQMVKRVEIPKAAGGIRELGIPTVVDRMIQQMILNVLQPKFDPTFSAHSYGFRPGRSAHQAVREAQRYVQEGRRWVVDVDLEKFFDRVNHDILMGRLARRIKDKRMLRLIRRYLEAGVMAQGVVIERWEGTPQGGPLSPLLANVLLDEVDKELEKRGHAFVRYADDGNVYVRSERAAKDVMATLKRLYAKLRLKVNETKSRIARVWNSQYLGYGFWVAKGKAVKHRVGAKALKVMKERVRRITSRNGGRSLEQIAKELRGYLPGWKEYFRLAETPGIFAQVDEWIGRRLRMVRLKQWKRGTTIFRELRRAGVSKAAAASVASCHRCWWKMAGTSALNFALPNAYFARLGVPRLAAIWYSVN